MSNRFPRRALSAAAATCLVGVSALLAFAASPASAADRVNFPSALPDAPGLPPTQLSGVLYKPDGTGPFPAVILLHACNGLTRVESAGVPLESTVVPNVAAWADILRHQGYVALAVDSFTPRGIGQVCGKAELAARMGRLRPADAYGGLRWLQRQAYVKPDRIGVMGWSHGGVAVLGTIWDLEILREPGGLRAPGAPADFRAAVAMYPGCGWAVPRGWTTRIPLLMLLGELDDWTPAKDCEDLATQARGKSATIDVHVYPGAYHGFDAPGVEVRTLKGIQTAANGHSAHVGTNPAAQQDSRTRVAEYFAKMLKE